MDSPEKQALHNLRQDLQSHMVITDRILRHLLQQNKINKSEKHDLSIHGASSQKIKKLIQILQNKGQPLQVLTEALLLENRNNFIVKKLSKKVRFYRSREEQSERNSKTHTSNQLDPLGEILFKRGYPVLYGSCHKQAYPKGHQKLMEGMNGFMVTLEDCRDFFNGCETRHFKDILKDFCDKKEKEIKDAKVLCARLVKSKNCELDQGSLEVNRLQQEVDKLKTENENIRRNWERDIRQKVTEGVRQRLLSMPMLSSCLGMPPSARAREHSESTDFSENSDQGSFSNGSYHSDHQVEESEGEREEEEGFVTETTDTESEAEYPNNRVPHVTYNIYTNHIYSTARLYQS
uniref:CARD domain-containing protein n=2 Tax=Magallana gigas TaxID=29159 RepID=A0A8W8N5B3_MAGGI|nr:uncharacterized protein LOC105328918 [Crassostrea gigas]XP_034312356.1 uncharacterized protein LOC105328918 [Crassostrea gigas]